MAPWKARFRYAHSYMAKSWFEGAEDDLPEPSTKLVTSAPRELAVVVPPMTIICVARAYTKFDMYSSTKWSHNISYYYEIDVALALDSYALSNIATDPQSRPLQGLSMGLEFNEFGDISYENNGVIRWKGESVTSIAGYHVGDAIGCGYLAPSRIFFTKNGEYLCQLDIDWQNPQARLPLTIRTVVHFEAQTDFYAPLAIPVNFGQRPFAFDIEGYIDAHECRARTIAANIPPELQELILRFAISLVDLAQPQSVARKSLRRLSHVCYRWRVICARHKGWAIEPRVKREEPGVAHIQVGLPVNHDHDHDDPDEDFNFNFSVDPDLDLDSEFNSRV